MLFGATGDLAHEKIFPSLYSMVRRGHLKEPVFGVAMNGDETLFTREDSVDLAWQIVQPILKSSAPPQRYDPGTWGPAGLERALEPPHGWIDPEP